MSVILDHGSLTNGRDQSIFYNVTGEFAHKWHYYKDLTILTNIQCVAFPTLKHYDNMNITNWHALPKENNECLFSSKYKMTKKNGLKYVECPVMVI
jgi:hypothetical protein